MPERWNVDLRRPVLSVAVLVTLLALGAGALTWFDRITLSTVRLTEADPEPVRRNTNPGAGVTHIERVATSVLGILLAVLLVVVILAMTRLRWRSPARAWERPASIRSAQLRHVLAAGRAAIDQPPGAATSPSENEAREAVIVCYVAMERALDEVGVVRGSVGTPSDLLSEAVERGLFASPSAAYAEELTDLFERARFSTPEVTDADRQRARELLARLDGAVPATGEVP